MIQRNRYIWAMAFSSDGRKLAVGDGSATVSLWDTATGKLLYRPWQEHTGEVHAVAVSPDGQRLASSDNHGLILVRDLSGGQPLQQWQLPQIAGKAVDVQHLVFTPDGQGLIAASDTSSNVYFLSSGAMREIPGEQGEGFSALRLSPSGKLLATAGKDRSIAIRRAEDGRVIHLLRGPLGVTTGLAFSPDGATLLTGTQDGTVQLWDVRLGRETITLEYPGRRVFRCFVIPPENRSLIGLDEDGDTQVWNMPTAFPHIGEE